MIKEEAETSHVCQAYDQSQANVDKRISGELLDQTRSLIRGRVTQWNLVGILIVAIKNLSTDIWRKSFIKVNLHPKHRVPFDKWRKRIGSHLACGEAAYTRKNIKSLSDAMPALWKNLSVQNRHRVISIIDKMNSDALKTQSNAWLQKTNLMKLSKFVKLDDVYKLRACHAIAKQDPDVIVNYVSVNDDEEETPICSVDQPAEDDVIFLIDDTDDSSDDEKNPITATKDDPPITTKHQSTILPSIKIIPTAADTSTEKNEIHPASFGFIHLQT